MNIVQLITRSDNIGGAQMHVLDLSISLQQLGHEVTVLVGGDGQFSELLQKKGITCVSISRLVRSIQPLDDYRAIIEIRSVIRRINPDIIATHSSKAGWLGRIVGKSLGIPTVFTAHGWAFAEGVPRLQRSIYIVAEKLAARLASRIVTVSKHDLKLALQYKVTTPEQLIAIHNGIPDLPNLEADPSQNPPRLVMVARFEPQKDHHTLIQALANLRDYSWQLDLIGDGPLRPDMEQMVVDLGLEKHVRFLGECSNVPLLLKDAQIFVLISNWEGLPISILEAMRAGMPVIASDVGGVCEMIEDGVNGYLIPRGDSQLLAKRMMELITNADLRIQFGLKGRNRFVKDFTSNHMNDQILLLYETLLKNRTTPGRDLI